MPKGSVLTRAGMQKCVSLSLKLSLQPSSVGTDAHGPEGAVMIGEPGKMLLNDAQDQNNHVDWLLACHASGKLQSWLGRSKEN